MGTELQSGMMNNFKKWMVVIAVGPSRNLQSLPQVKIPVYVICLLL